MDDDWEHIESPNALRVPDSPPPRTPQLAAAAVIRENYLQISVDSAIFPPADHEGLDLNDPAPILIPLPPNSPLSSTSSSSGTAPPGNGKSSSSAPSISPGDGIEPRSGVRGVVLRAWNRLLFGVSGWKLVSTVKALGVVAAAAASFLYLTEVMRRRRQGRSKVAVGDENSNRLINLIKEKDRIINQLLLQISHMNELISARRQVPVLRMG